MNVDAYLQRLGYHGPLAPNAETLRRLHLAHILSVPFENLDIHLGRPIILDEKSLYDKIVRQRRGGFCYELNGLFAALMRELGFVVSLHSGRVFDNGQPGPEFDHLTLLVQLEERWLADVGFGDSFREPLRLDVRPRRARSSRSPTRLDDPADQLQFGGAYRLIQAGDKYTMQRQLFGENWKPQYRFTLRPYQLADFTDMCHYHQTSPESHFTQKRICSRATPEGRITLSDMRLIITQNGQREEKSLTDQEEYATALHEYFGIDISSK
jgi:N-hydroxyarylamine O-acetyltransferase